MQGVVGRRVGRDGAQGQGLAPGVGAGGDAVVDGGAEELSNPSSGSRSREGVSSSRSNSPCLSRARATGVAWCAAGDSRVLIESCRRMQGRVIVILLNPLMRERLNARILFMPRTT